MTDLPEPGSESAPSEFIKPFLEHLEHLRWMIKMIITLAITMFLSFFFARNYSPQSGR
jgi:hypothetical protein